MNPIHKIVRNVSSDKKVLKTLNTRQKIRFIFDYYRGYFFCFILLSMALLYIGEVVWQSHQETVLQGFFTNDRGGYFSAKAITEDLSSYMNLKRGQQVILDDSLYVELGSSSEYITASQSKIVAYIAAQELDFLVAGPDLTEYYMGNLSLYDLEALMGPDLSKELKDAVCYQKDKTGTLRACGLDLSQSRFLKSADEPDGPYILMVPSTAPHPEAVAAFIRYSFGLPVH